MACQSARLARSARPRPGRLALRWALLGLGGVGVASLSGAMSATISTPGAQPRAAVLMAALGTLLATGLSFTLRDSLIAARSRDRSWPFPGARRTGDRLRTRLLALLRTPGPWWVEVLLIGAMNQLYELIRSLAPTRIGQAFANAHALERLEAALHLGVERRLNQALEHLPALIPPMSVYYQVGHLVALLTTLAWAWRRHPDRYAPARTALLALSLTALAGYWFVPTAPPRFALAGAVDTVAAHPVLFAGNDNLTGMVNLYAAMPSLHVAWAVWVALTVSHLSGGRWRRLAWAHPAATVLVVLATANHYLADAVAGAALALAAWALLHHRHRPGGQVAVVPPVLEDQLSRR